MAPQPKLEFSQMLLPEISWAVFFSLVKHWRCLSGGKGGEDLRVWEKLRNIIGNKKELNQSRAYDRESTSYLLFPFKINNMCSAYEITTVLAIQNTVFW